MVGSQYPCIEKKVPWENELLVAWDTSISYLSASLSPGYCIFGPASNWCIPARRQQMMNQVLGPLRPMWDSQIELLVPHLDLAIPSYRGCLEVNQLREDLPLCLFSHCLFPLLLTLLFKNINKSWKKIFSKISHYYLGWRKRKTVTFWIFDFYS